MKTLFNDAVSNLVSLFPDYVLFFNNKHCAILNCVDNVACFVNVHDVCNGANLCDAR
jgi:hypothetical protein